MKNKSIDYRLQMVACESFKDKSDLTTSNEGAVGDYFKNTFSPFRWVYNKILTNEKDYKKRIEIIKKYINEGVNFNTDYILNVDKTNKTSKDIISNLQDLLDLYKKCNFKGNLKEMSTHFNTLKDIIKSVWVYNNSKEVSKLNEIKEKIYVCFVNMFTDGKFNSQKLTDNYIFNNNLYGSHFITYTLKINKELESITHLGGDEVEGIFNLYIEHGEFTNISKNSLISNSDLNPCQESDKAKIKQLLIEITKELDYALVSLIETTRKGENMLGWLSMQHVNHLSRPAHLLAGGPIGLLAKGTMLDLRTGSNAFDVLVDTRKLLNYIFSDTEKIVKSAMSYIS